MYKLKTGIKSKLIGEVMAMIYLFLLVLSNKYITVKWNSTGILTTIISLVVWVCYCIYDKKYGDIVDESSKRILSKVNEIAIKVILYSVVLIVIYFGTPYTQNINISNLDTSIILVLVLFIQSLLKLVLFIYFDRKGIYD